MTLALAAPERANVVLITLDTTRADALSCYGEPVPGIAGELPGPTTPNLDRLAAEGLLARRAYAHAPTTLASHASILTGLDLHEHAIPRNGFPLASSHTTLAERLEHEGYDTLAAIGAQALESLMGLNQGFRRYDDSELQSIGVMYQDRAEGVTDRALALVDERSPGKPVFLWAHYYDPHQPFEAPEPFTSRFAPGTEAEYDLAALRERLLTNRPDAEAHDALARRYLAEVAYMDHHIGRLLDGLEARGLLDNALIVVTADHGETLSEGGSNAWTHGAGVDDGAVRVPLLFWSSGSVVLGGPGEVHRQVELAALAPTIERAVGLLPTLGHGRDAWDLFRPGPVLDEDGWPMPTRTVFTEATRPQGREYEDGWNNLLMERGLRAGGTTLVTERFGLRRVSLDAPPAAEGLTWLLTRQLLDWIDHWDATAPAYRPQRFNSNTLKALQALGYLDDDAPEPSSTPVENSEDRRR